MKETDGFIKAYHDFKESVDFTKAGIMPDLDNLVWFMLTGVPYVPADEDPSDDAAMTAIEQRVTILKTRDKQKISSIKAWKYMTRQQRWPRSCCRKRVQSLSQNRVTFN
jgi:hypothetical protein